MERKRGPLRIGASRAIIDIPQAFFPCEGFTGIHDNLHARAIVLDNGKRRLAIIVVELTSLGSDFIDEVRNLISYDYGFDLKNIFVCASHTFQAPHLKPAHSELNEDEITKNELYKEALLSAILLAVRQAKERMQGGRLGFGLGQCNVNVNGDVLTSRGWWKGSNLQGLSDKTVAVIRFETLNGKPIAFFVNYPVQSGIMLESTQLDGNKLVSSDLLGYAAKYMERQYNDEVVALWTVGAAGDQDPLFIANRHTLDRFGNYGRADIHENGYVLIELLGERLGCEAVRASENINRFRSEIIIKVVDKIVTCPGQKIFENIHEMQPRKEYEYHTSEPLELPVHIIVIDDVALIGVKPELVCKTSLQIKAASPYKNTVIMTMVNGGAKYLPDAESYDNITYAAMNSMGAKGSAEILRDEIVKMLDDIVFE